MPTLISALIAMTIPMMALPIAIAWWRRMPSFGVDLLRPTSRRQLHRDLIAALAIDFAPSVIITLYVLSAIDFDPWSPSNWPAVAIFWTGLCLVMYANILIAMTVRSRRAILLGLPVALFPVALTLGAGVAAIGGLTLVLIGVALFRLARRRWWEMEFP